jgi:hypothetical protein
MTKVRTEPEIPKTPTRESKDFPVFQVFTPSGNNCGFLQYQCDGTNASGYYYKSNDYRLWTHDNETLSGIAEQINAANAALAAGLI